MAAVQSATTNIQPAASDSPPGPDMVWVPGGTFLMGSDDHYPEEAPAHRATVGGFWIDRHPVTNAEFVERDRSRDPNDVAGTMAAGGPSPAVLVNHDHWHHVFATPD